MRTRKRRIQLQRLSDGRLGLRHGLLGRRASLLGVSEPKVDHGQLCICWRISRILFDRCPKMINRPLGIQFRELGSEIQAAEIVVLHLRVHQRAIARQPIFLLRGKLDLNFIGDCACNLGLQTQNIVNAVVLLGPQLAFG